MTTSSPDITVNLPRELFDALSEVIITGLQRSKIAEKDRRELTAWWAAERDIIVDELDKK